eukprot:3529751-Lingulodinium_polyedra.AAC.1
MPLARVSLCLAAPSAFALLFRVSRVWVHGARGTVCLFRARRAGFERPVCFRLHLSESGSRWARRTGCRLP